MSPASIREALSRHVPETTPFRADPDRAAVALALAGEELDLQICFIRRVEKSGDPWSGHIAFPGGRAAPGDVSARAVAERETQEEVGLILRDTHLLGALSEMPVRRNGLDTSMVLSPFVYHLGPSTARLTPNDEVAEAYWIPLELARDGSSMVFPAIRFHEHFIWGLTHRVLALFSDLLGRTLPRRL
jgi:8-oxo-dGTP pyrophosphatase MutT (NUDIX family)